MHHAPRLMPHACASAAVHIMADDCIPLLLLQVHYAGGYDALHPGVQAGLYSHRTGAVAAGPAGATATAQVQ